MLENNFPKCSSHRLFAAYDIFHGLLLAAFVLALLSFSAIQASAARELYNYLGDGVNPNLDIELGDNGTNTRSYTIGYNSHGGVPESTDPNKQWSSWNVRDSKTRTSFGTITLNNTPKELQLTRYEHDTLNYLETPVVRAGSTDNPALHALGVIFSYCDPAEIINNIGNGQPAITLWLVGGCKGNQQCWKQYALAFEGKGQIPGGWSLWDAKDEKSGVYYGTIKLNNISRVVSCQTPCYDPPKTPGNTCQTLKLLAATL